MTKSEILFEKFCQARGIPYDRVPTGTAKTPDYNIYVNGTKISVEVKETDPNPKEQQKIKEFDSQGTITIKNPLGTRIRGKITDASGKFKEAVQNGHPSILVLHNNVRLYKHTSPLDILAGMYGQLYFPVSGNPGASLRIGKIKSGPKKKMTPYANTSISAVGVLEQSNNGDPDLSIYYNFHAKVPLNPLLLSPFYIKQYRVNDRNNPTGWIEKPPQ